MAELMSEKNVKIIFGLKIKSYRTAQKLSLLELSKKSGIAVSYLSEIESGKKYPKPEKMVQLSQALGIDYDALVSTQVSKKLDPLAALLNSDLVKLFPFHLFGISARDILGLFKNSPENAHAFLETFLQIGRAYDMSLENFLFAALRTYVRQHNNYFPDLETKGTKFLGRQEGGDFSPSWQNLKNILERDYSYAVEEIDFNDYQGLGSLRSVLKKEQHLAINALLQSSQKAFILAKEIGFAELGVKERPITSSWIKVKNFDQLVNNFKASYFAGTLLMPQKPISKGIEQLLSQEIWDSEVFQGLIEKYHITPEMLLHRMSQLLPKLFDLPSVFYLRFVNGDTPPAVVLTKELNMTEAPITYGTGYNEHHCRRLLPLRLLKKISTGSTPLLVGVQKITFVTSDAHFILLSMARPLSLSKGRGSAVALGIKLDKKAESKLKFLHDSAITTEKVSESCERCPLTDCSERVVEASIISSQNVISRREESLQNFLNA